VPIKPTKSPVVLLFDVDNTLLSNDDIVADLKSYLRREVGARRQAEYWRIFEGLRDELGYADYLGALQRYRNEHPRDPHLLLLSRFMIDYPFHKRVFPKAFDAIARARKLGRAVILSDGDVVFQPRKVDRSGLGRAVLGQVLIYVHKEKELDDVARRHPAGHYVLIDDKLRILAAVKAAWGSCVTTIFVRQGHYATDRKILSSYPPADITLERIGDFVKCDLTSVLKQKRN
jgi:FMN phosphatase YigB (HAD superfamily)